MSSYLEIRDKAVEQIKEGILPLYPKMTIDAHPGLFTELSIKRDAQRTPAILTSLVKAADGTRDSVTFVSWVLYRADSKDRLYDGALKIISALIPVIREIDAEWSIGGGTDIEAECLYSGALDQINVTLWGVRWKWKIQDTLFSEGEGGVLFDDLEYFEGYDAAHHIGSAVAKDIVDLEVLHASTVKANSGEPFGSGSVSGSR